MSPRQSRSMRVGCWVLVMVVVILMVVMVVLTEKREEGFGWPGRVRERIAGLRSILRRRPADEERMDRRAIPDEAILHSMARICE